MLGILDLLRELVFHILINLFVLSCYWLLISLNVLFSDSYFSLFFHRFPVDITFYRCSNCRGNVYSMKNKYIMKYQVSQTDIRLRYCIPDFINQFDDFS